MEVIDEVMEGINEILEIVLWPFKKAWRVLFAILIIFGFALIYIFCGIGSLLTLPFFLREQKKKEQAASLAAHP